MRLRRALEATLRERPRDPGAARRGRRPPARPGERRERGARPRRGRPGRRRPARRLPDVRPVRVANAAARPRVAPCGGRSVRSPAPWVSSRRCAPLPSRLPRTASSPRSRTAVWSRSTPTAAGCARCPCATPEQITELAWSPGGNRLAFVKAGGYRRPRARHRADPERHRAGGGDANPGWSADGTKIGFRRGLLLMTVLAAGGAPPRAVRARAAGRAPAQIAWAPNLQASPPWSWAASWCCRCSRRRRRSPARRRGRRTARRSRSPTTTGWPRSSPRAATSCR